MATAQTPPTGLAAATTFALGCDPGLKKVIDYGIAFEQEQIAVNKHGHFYGSDNTEKYMVKFEGEYFRGYHSSFFSERIVNSSIYPTKALTWFATVLSSPGLKEAEAVAGKLNVKLAEYKISVKKCEQVVTRWAFIHHHPNVISIHTITRFIKTEVPLIVLDVDFCLIYTQKKYMPVLGFYSEGAGDERNQPRPETTEPDFDFQTFLDDIQRKASKSEVIFLTNGGQPRKRLAQAGVILPEGMAVLEPPKKLALIKDINERRIAADKGTRLKQYISDRGIGFTAVHALDDDLGCLEQVAEQIEQLRLAGHTYHYIRQYRQSCYHLALADSDVSSEEEVTALKSICEKNNEHIASLAAQRILLPA